MALLGSPVKDRDEAQWTSEVLAMKTPAGYEPSARRSCIGGRVISSVDGRFES
jgi:hypothetical protein